MTLRTILLNPGPVTLSPRVREAMLGPDLCHREPEFAALQTGIRERLLAVYDLPASEWASILLTGSGTAAVEAMITSLVPNHGRVLVVENGVYGERISNIARRHQIACTQIAHDWLSAPDLARIEAVLSADGPFTHVAVVHHETTSGRLNALGPLAELCKRFGVRLLLDAVSSFGAEEIEAEAWNIDAMAATANKCLHAVPGTCFVVARREALANGVPVPRSVYLDLATYLRNQDAHGTPFTQSIQTFYALSAALEELAEQGGREARAEQYRARMARVRQTLLELGVRPLLPEGQSSCVLNGFHLPSGLSYDPLHDGLKARGFIIYAGQSALAQQIFRISTMGDISPADMDRLCAALREVIAPYTQG